MKRKLPNSYDIAVDKMVDATITQEKNGFKVKQGNFFNKSSVIVPRQILVKENKKIFFMKDGKFVLEVEQEEDVIYFYSDNLDDLTK